jgi:hypothetical protein
MAMDGDGSIKITEISTKRHFYKNSKLFYNESLPGQVTVVT